MIKDRVKQLIGKIISVKGLFFLSSFALMAIGRLEAQYFFYSGLIFVGLRTAEKFITILKK